MKNLLIATILSFFVAVGAASAQSPKTAVKALIAPNTQSVVPASSTPIGNGLSNTERERDLYKMMYENSASANEKLLTLTQWTLGVSLAIVLGIIASQVFFNYRINKKEIDSISSGIQEQLARLELDVSQKINDNLGKTTSTLESDKKALAIELRAVIEKEFSANEKMLDLEFKVQKADLLREIKRLKRSAAKDEGDIWYLKGVKANALRPYIEAANIDIETGFEEKYIVDDIIKVLGEIDEIHHPDYEIIEKMLPKIKAANNHHREKLLSAVKDKPTYKFEARSSDSFGGFSFLGLGLHPRTYVRNKPVK